MKTIARSRNCFAAALFVFLGGAPGCSYFSGMKFKVEEQVTLSMPIGATQEISVRTHNGHITVAGVDGSAEIVARVHKQARARTLERAKECMAAIELTTEESGTTQVLGWKWNTTRASDWSATVAFDIEVPEHLSATVKTHNGRVDVTGIDGDCKAETHNGRIRIASASRKVDVEAHNGRINIESPSEEIRAITHNGTIVAELSGSGSVSGKIRTHNGNVTLAMSDAASANFRCSTRNGRVSSKIDLTDMTTSRGSLAGRKGDASGELRIKAFNGSITLKETE